MFAAFGLLLTVQHLHTGGGWIDRGPILTVAFGAILTVAFRTLFQSRLKGDNDVCSCCQARRWSTPTPQSLTSRNGVVAVFSLCKVCTYCVLNPCVTAMFSGLSGMLMTAFGMFLWPLAASQPHFIVNI